MLELSSVSRTVLLVFEDNSEVMNIKKDGSIKNVFLKVCIMWNVKAVLLEHVAVLKTGFLEPI